MLEMTESLQQGSAEPLYQQLYAAIVRQIREGRLPVGERMPGKRSLASQLAVSVNTVDTAYQMLVAEGYLESRPRSGFFVQDVPQVFSAPVSPVMASVKQDRLHWRFDCSTGSVDPALFPFRSWARIQRELLFNQPELLRHGHKQGDENLREAVAEYLHAYRGVACAPDQIVVGAGVEYLLGIAASLLKGSAAAVEEPGYSRSRTILENNGICCIAVPLDGAGLQVDALQQSGANLCYVTPSHHFPTGVTMPVGRRAQLLQWASQPGHYIFEDDYDAEFRFDTRPIPSLQGMAGPEGPVLYLCTFSKSLAPSIRIACMVLPRGLLPLYRRMFGTYSNTVGRFDQQTLCRFLTEGHFARHLSHMRNVYHKRMQRLCAALEVEFGRKRILLQGRHTGLHLMLTLKDGPGETEMVRRAHEAGVRLSGLSEYYRDGTEERPSNTVILGYAALQDGQIDELARTLKELWIR